MKTGKHLLSVLLTILLLLSTSITAFAEPSNASPNVDGMIKVTDDVVREIALNWSKAQDPDLNLSVDNLVKVYDQEERITGYSVGYFLNDQPYGYAIIDFFVPDYIAEYNIEENVPDMYSAIVEYNNISNITGYSLAAPKLYEGLPTEYNVVERTEAGNVYVDNTGIARSEEEFIEYQSEIEESLLEIPTTYSDTNQATSYSGADIFINSIPSNYSLSESGRYNITISFPQGTWEMMVQKYACEVSALSNISLLLGKYEGADTYNELWDLTGTTVYETRVVNGKTIQYGSTLNGNGGPALCTYLSRRGMNAGYSFIANPEYGTFKSAIDAKYPCMLTYAININGSPSGHAVTVEGYAKGKNNDTGAISSYLLVADGWNGFCRYLNYYSISYLRIHATIWDGVQISYGY